jgi:DNA-binding HxlR family transcriptional regulator
MPNSVRSRKHRSLCPIARSLDLLGDKWTLLVMRDALFFGRSTFAEFASNKEKIPTNLLSNRLKRLVDLGLLEKVQYHTRPQRFEYLPTGKGKALKPVLKSLRRFGEEQLRETTENDDLEVSP